MTAIRFSKQLDAPIAGMPELTPLVGKSVEIIVLDAQSDVLVTADSPTRKVPRAGTAKGTIWMADDFDGPLDDFKDYM